MQRALRPKPVEVVSDEPWIWGNTRGGGGAPLKLADGTPVANLRDVMKGNVQPDHSPTRSPTKLSLARNFEDDDDSNNIDYDDRRDNERRAFHRGANRRSNRNRGYVDDDGDNDNGIDDRRGVRSPPVVRGLEDHYNRQPRRRHQDADADYAPPPKVFEAYVDPEKALKAK
jgi:hypothetical protein